MIEYTLTLTPDMLDTFLDLMIEYFPEEEELDSYYMFDGSAIDDIVFWQLLDQLEWK